MIKLKYLKHINILVLVVLLNGCSVIGAVKTFWPTPHDSALAKGYIDTKMGVTDLDCSDKTSDKSNKLWEKTQYKARWLDTYADFRQDTQKESTAAIVENLYKAHTAKSEKACEIWINLVKARMEVLDKAWKGRD